MSRPDGVSAERWKAVRPVLQAIERYPNAHPSVACLMQSTRKSERSIRRALRWAEEAALLKTNLSTGRGLANEYEVLCCEYLKGAKKGGHVAPLRRGTTYLHHYVGVDELVNEGKPRRRAVVAGQPQPKEPWWMREVRLPKKPSEVWPRDEEGRRLALLDGVTETTRCQACGQPIRRREPGTNRILPPSGVLVDWRGSEKEVPKEVPVHMPGGCAGSRPGQGFIKVGDIGRHLRVV